MLLEKAFIKLVTQEGAKPRYDRIDQRLAGTAAEVVCAFSAESETETVSLSADWSGVGTRLASSAETKLLLHPTFPVVLWTTAELQAHVSTRSSDPSIDAVCISR